MANPITVKTSRLTDESVFVKIAKFASENDIPNITFAFPHKQITLNKNENNEFDRSDDLLKGVLELNGHYIQRTTCGIRGIQVVLTREDSHDLITITPSNNNPVADDAILLKYLQDLKTLFVELDSKKIITDFFGEDVKQFYEHREMALLRLEGLSQKLIEHNEEYRLSIDKEKDSFESEIAKKYEEKEALLLEEKSELDKREKEMDLSDAKSSRRRLRRDLLEQMKPTRIIADDTGKRWPIHLLFLFVSGLLSYSLFRLFADPAFDPTNPAQSIKTVLFTVGIVGTLTVYYRWMDAWQRLKVDESLRLRQLSIDVDRANWIVEMLSEYKTDNEVIPPEVVTALTKNMFSTRKNTDGVTHPAEDMLAALLGSSKAIEVDLPNGKLTTDGKSIKKASEKVK